MSNKTLAVLSAAVLVFAVGFIGCGGDDDGNGGGPTGPDYSNQLYPLWVGNWWAYDVKAYADTILVQSGSDTIRIDTTITWGGQTWFGSMEQGEFYRNAGDGVWLLDFGEGPSPEPDLAYKYPATVGETWVIYSGEDTLTASVESISETVTVPAGQFTGCCYYRVLIPEEDMEVYAWFKVGVGMVKQGVAGQQMGVHYHTDWLLRQYHLE